MIMRMLNSMAVDRPRVMASVWARVVSKSVTGRRKRALFHSHPASSVGLAIPAEKRSLVCAALGM